MYENTKNLGLLVMEGYVGVECTYAIGKGSKRYVFLARDGLVTDGDTALVAKDTFAKGALLPSTNGFDKGFDLRPVHVCRILPIEEVDPDIAHAYRFIIGKVDALAHKEDRDEFKRSTALVTEAMKKKQRNLFRDFLKKEIKGLKK